MANNRLSFSIVIPSYKRADLLHDCLTSVTQFAPPHTQIIVVDDGSINATISQTAQRFPSVTVIRHPRSLGFCRAANHGLDAATGDIVELLNDDTVVTANWAEAAISCFDDVSVGCVAPLTLMGEPGNWPVQIDSAGDDYDLGGFAKKIGHRTMLRDHHRQPCDVFGASGSSAFYRRSMLQQIGHFPANFGSYFEDVDLSWRIRHAGFRTLYQPNSVVWHRVGASHQRRRKLHEQQSRNEERVFWRNVPDLAQALPRHLAVLCGKALRRLQDGTFWPFAFGRLRAISELGQHLTHRQSWHSRTRKPNECLDSQETNHIVM